MEAGIEAIQGRGNAYDFGLKQAEELKQTALFQRHMKRRKKSIRRYTTDFLETKSWVRSLTPLLWEELNGLADGLNWRIEDVIHEYGGYQQSWIKSGCSAMMKSGIYARNYDYHPKTYDGRFVLWQPEEGYAHIGFAQRIIGRMDGMNEHGLAVGYHFVNRVSPEDGFICCSIARLVLDSCRNIEEAVEVLTELPHRHSFNYSLADASGSSAVVEGSAKGTSLLKDHGDVCTNHFRSPGKSAENRHRTEESEARLHRLSALLEQNPDRREMFSMLNDLSFNIAKTDYKNWSGTIHTAVYDTVNQHVLAGIGVNAKPVSISFKNWLKGERFIVKKLRGKITHLEDSQHLRADTARIR
ncbi:C45 family autoproteolytic acyltransferase/hydolase [Alkalicoccus halolimnae]|uniref:C45 family peptidase n=1 Tax=Alkalicoccus halolimnae TaxID=1667239 RepID=A0A5C7FMJ9_9BACI|nr:C45 family peptidase [Alkalicoccus halolimnae]TXF87199.1 acyl-CoA--6-aminopenicillanic acid acyl-transferase [Alkalicoccus halolimnae]